jgi:hypothetical protein
MPEEARAMGLPLTMPTSQTQSGVKFPAAFRVENLPKGDLQGASIIMKSGSAKDTVLYIAGVVNDSLMIGFGAGSFRAVTKIREGDEISIDNSVYIASQTYHRYQVQPPEFYVWEQFKDKDGKPIYPQRPKNIQAGASGGSSMSGNFHGKMMIMQAMMDEAAYPWQADWFRTRIKNALGDEFKERYRLYYIDNTMHTTQRANRGDPHPVATTRVISYQGALQQMLRDLVNWVEKGIAPPDETNYKIEHGQVIVPDTASERKGIQPVVTLTVNGSKRADIKAGDTVEFSAVIEVPPNAGKVVKAEWDFDGGGDYPFTETFAGIDLSQTKVTLETTYTFSKSGTYFPVLRASSHREGSTATRYALVQNLDRVRIVVR